MVSSKECTKTDPKDDKILSVTTRMSKLDKKKLSLQQFNEEKVIEPILVPTLNWGTPTRVMMRDLTIFNPGDSRNQRKILPDMDNTCGGAPSTRCRVNFMECT